MRINAYIRGNGRRIEKTQNGKEIMMEHKKVKEPVRAGMKVRLYNSFTETSDVFEDQVMALGNLSGGMIRSGKETVVVELAKRIITEAVKETPGLTVSKLEFEERKKVDIPFSNCDYFNVVSETIGNNIIDNLEEHSITIEIDLAVFYAGTLVLAIELKAFTDLTMFRRLAFDFHTLKRVYPTVKYVLIQLENSLGGDYAQDVPEHLGSPGVHSVLAEVNLPMTIITLLNGKRSSQKAIHMPGCFKGLNKIKFRNAVNTISTLLVTQTKRKHINFL